MTRRVLQALKGFLVSAADAVAVVAYLANRRRPKDGLTILVYHRIAEGLPRWAPYEANNVQPHHFREQLDRLDRMPWVTVISARDVVDWLSTGAPAQGCYLLLTCDDVWQACVAAAEELHRRRLSAVFFVSTGHLGSPVYPFSPFDAWYAGRPGADPARYRPATLADCRRLRELGMDVQPHGHTHRALGRLAPSEVAEEVRESIRFVTERIGQEVFCFSYPYGNARRGDLTDATETELRSNGIRFALTTDAGTNPLAELPRRALRLRRTVIRDHDRGLRFEAKVAGYAGGLPLLKRFLYPAARSTGATAGS